MVILNFLAAPRAARTGRARNLGEQEKLRRSFSENGYIREFGFMQPDFICVYLPAIMPAAWAVVSTPSPTFLEYFGFATFVPFITFLVF